ncbi:MAG: hypothetical protein RJB38_341 [Pseudomonadota bacterium]|jgi:uncharacterized protein YdiU (UPF0061 family)
MTSLDALVFFYRFIENLPGATLSPTPSRHTPGIFFAETPPTAVARPELLLWSSEAAQLMELPRELGPDLAVSAAQIFSGNRLPAGTRPYATRYGGHQFGHWAGQLGDGRALSLGELPASTPEGSSTTLASYEIQLKGAGPTPYSRKADGRAVLRSSVREFLCSEALFYLGVPTTRALCCVTTGEAVVRDLFYDGNPKPEPGAITTRVAPSFLRFGHFEILAAEGEIPLLRALLQKTIEGFFPQILIDGSSQNLDEPFLIWFETVATTTRELMIEWQRVGFVHGVMNTDNLSILGLTIDFGPYGWMEAFDPNWTPNTTDAEHRRYRFGNQPSIALWNLSRLAGAVLAACTDPSKSIARLEATLERYRTEFRSGYLRMRARKLGFWVDSNEEFPVELATLIEALDQLLFESQADMTLFYRSLAENLKAEPLTAEASTESILRRIQQSFEEESYSSHLPTPLKNRWNDWLKTWISLSAQEQWRFRTDVPKPHESLASYRYELMNRENPFFILRNYLVQEALDALEVQNQEPLDRLMQALKHPYSDQEITRSYFKKRPEWAKNRPGCSALSCSS